MGKGGEASGFRGAERGVRRAERVVESPGGERGGGGLELREGLVPGFGSVQP